MDIQKEESFRHWLPLNGVDGGSIGSYVSRIKNLEHALNDDIDKLIQSDDLRLLDRINHETIPAVSKWTLSDIKTAVRKYCRCFYPNSKIIAKKR
jgi:hypothetical protein